MNNNKLSPNDVLFKIYLKDLIGNALFSDAYQRMGISEYADRETSTIIFKIIKYVNENYGSTSQNCGMGKTPKIKGGNIPLAENRSDTGRDNQDVVRKSVPKRKGRRKAAPMDHDR